MKFSSLFIFVLLATTFAALPKRKNLAGPVTDFDLHKVPTREQTGQLANSAEQWASLKVDATTNQLSDTLDIVVDSTTHFLFSVGSPHIQYLDLSLTSPSGSNVVIDAKKGSFPLSDDNEKSLPDYSFIISDPEVGTYKLTFVLSSETPVEIRNEIEKAASPVAQVLVYNESPIRAFAYLNTFKLVPGKQVGLVSRITEDENIVGIPSASKETVTYAEMDIVLPDGEEIDVEMKDDGLHMDEEANDGIYGASIKASAPGVYLATAIMKGKTSTGAEFMRSTQHMINVIDEDLALTGVASTSATDENDRVTVYLDVANDSQAKWRVFAEVWGTDSSTGAAVPVCWIGGMSNVEKINGKPVVEAELDLKWITMSKASAPFTLRNIYVSDAESSIPVAEVSEMKLQVHTSAFFALKRLFLSNNLPSEPTEEMKMGIRPAHLSVDNTTEAVQYTLLSHGYCTETNPFQLYSGWTNALFYLEPSANNLNDKFALNLNSFAESKGATAFTGVGHSQGGVALLHLKNYYWSGLDVASEGRKIQSLGTPFQGSTAAGSSANLAKSFGVGCGENFDLSLDGAKLWLSGITAEARAEVYYYTTTYQQGKLFGDWCNLATNTVLQWPNDGVTESKFADLPGGNNQGNTEKQCHTTDMGYMAQYHDNSRNAVMAQKALNKNA